MPSRPGAPDTLAFARYYLEQGLRPFPLGPRSKRPQRGFRWAEAVAKDPTLADLSKWFGAGERNLGLATGAGLLAVDFDGPGAEELLAAAGVELPQDAPRSATARGAHVFLSVPAGVTIPNGVELLASEERRPDGKPVCQVDIRGDGGYVVAPPSVHETGHVYTWDHRISSISQIPAAPEALLSLIRQKSLKNGPGDARRRDPRSDPSGAEKWLAEALRGVRKGLRDVTCTKLAGYYLGKKMPLDVVRSTLYAWAELCQPPFPHSQVDKCVESVERKEAAAPRPAADTAAPEFQILGYNQGSYFYLPRGARQVVELRAEGHTKLNLLRLAPMQYWESAYGDRKGIAWDMAANALIQQAHAAGVYDTSRIRGRGAWWDADSQSAVLHLGDVLVRGGVRTPVGALAGDRYVYEAAPPIDLDLDSPLGSDEANVVVQIAELVTWKRPVSAHLFAGWCALAPVCGALTWRPHIWLTGAAGTGKTWVLEQVLRPLLGSIGLSVQSETTEAGLRQTLGHDARPVTFDEIEGEDERAQLRVQNVLALARQASSETGAVIVKGSAFGQPRTYRIRSCFAFSSIGVGVEKHADATRVSVLEIERHPGSDAEREAHFKRIQALAAETITEGFTRRFLARSVAMAGVIRANTAPLAAAAAAVIGSQRLGDQVGALLAGAYSLYQDGPIAPADAREWVGQLDWSEARETQEATDELLCLNRILEHTVRVQTRSGPADRSVADLIRTTAVMGGGDPPDAEGILGRMGIRVDRQGNDQDWLTISNTHTGVAEILRGTPWAKGWPRVLRRVAGARQTDGSVRFGATRGRGVEIPLEAIE